ncbi:MAG: hypothetical protein HUK25_04830, partial [Treponema sp.]|nr:hypothetical protein [Treponema sp.]
GVQWIGMNTKGTLPEEGERITQITDGTAAEVKVTFEGNANDDKGVYLSDNLGNTTDLNNPPYVIYGVLDTTAPAVSYSGTSKILSASLYVKGDGNFTVTDTISGVSASSEPVTFTNNEAVIKDNVGNSVTVYLDDTAPLVGNVSYTSGDSGKHIYSFSVMETGSGVSKIVMNGMKDLSQMNGIISLTIDGSAQTYTFSKTDDHSFLLSLSAPVKLSGKTVSMELYYGDKGDGTDGGPVWSASDVKVYDMLDNEGSGSEAALPNLNYFGQASAGKKLQIGIGSLSEQGIVYRAVSSVRNIFNPSVKDSGIVQAEEKTLENKKQSRLSNKDEVYEEKSKVLTVKEKAPKDLRKRAKNSETKIQQISESEAQVTEIISENILVSEPEIASDLISSESSAQNVQKDNYVAKESPDVYNYIILAVFAVILLLAVTGGVIMFLVQKRRTVQNK